MTMAAAVAITERVVKKAVPLNAAVRALLTNSALVIMAHANVAQK
jgi:hypothetical protein